MSIFSNRQSLLNKFCKFKIKISKINSPQEKLLGVILDDQINFKRHMSNLYKKASQKLNALELIFFYGFSEMPAYDYCLLDWMMHSRYINNKTNSVHERVQRIVDKDNFFSF